MPMMRKFLALAVAAVLVLVSALAGEAAPGAAGQGEAPKEEAGLLPINGGFLGKPSGYSPAPGWTLTPDGGSARVLPGKGAVAGILELRAAPDRAQSLVSDFFPVASAPGCKLRMTAHQLEFAGEVSPQGAAGKAPAAYGIGYVCEFYGADRARVLRTEGIGQEFPFPSLQFPGSSAGGDKLKSFTAKAALSDFVHDCDPIPPEARFVRLRLTAPAGAVATFRSLSAAIVGQSQAAVLATALGAQPGAAPAPEAAAKPAKPRYLPVNGDFRPFKNPRIILLDPALGWTLAPGAGWARRLPTNDPNQWVLEVQAPPDSAQVVVSDFFPVGEGRLMVSLASARTGLLLSLGCEVYDADRARVIYERAFGFLATPRGNVDHLDYIFNKTRPDPVSPFKLDLPPQARFARLRLAARPGTIVRFRGLQVAYYPAGTSEAEKPEPLPEQPEPLLVPPEPDNAAAPADNPGSAKQTAPAKAAKPWPRALIQLINAPAPAIVAAPAPGDAPAKETPPAP